LQYNNNINKIQDYDDQKDSSQSILNKSGQLSIRNNLNNNYKKSAY